MKKASLVFSFRDGKVLLGVKRGGPEVGEGKLNGPGGKFEPELGDKVMLDCAERETLEETGILIDRAQTAKLGVATFFTASVPYQEVHVYRTNAFTGEPTDTKSMHRFGWYDPNDLPFDRMHDGDQHWLPMILKGGHSAHVYYRERGRGFERVEFFPFTDHEPAT